jgi:hypothetical protein
VKEFKYLGNFVTNRNSIQEEIKRGLKPGNDCYYSVQKFVFQKTQRLKCTEFTFSFFYGYETWSPKLREESWLRVFDNRVLRRIYEPKRARQHGSGENYIMRSLMNCTAQNILLGQSN